MSRALGSTLSTVKEMNLLLSLAILLFCFHFCYVCSCFYVIFGFLFCFAFFCFETVFHSVTWAGLETHGDPPASVSLVLALQACVTPSSLAVCAVTFPLSHSLNPYHTPVRSFFPEREKRGSPHPNSLVCAAQARALSAGSRSTFLGSALGVHRGMTASAFTWTGLRRQWSLWVFPEQSQTVGSRRAD